MHSNTLPAAVEVDWLDGWGVLLVVPRLLSSCSASSFCKPYSVKCLISIPDPLECVLDGEACLRAYPLAASIFLRGEIRNLERQ